MVLIAELAWRHSASEVWMASLSALLADDVLPTLLFLVTELLAVVTERVLVWVLSTRGLPSWTRRLPTRLVVSCLRRTPTGLLHCAVHRVVQILIGDRTLGWGI
jgi:hypothetical protein